MRNQIDNFPKLSESIPLNPQMGNQFCNSKLRFSDKMIQGNFQLQRHSQNEKFQTIEGKKKKLSLKQSFTQLDPDSHIISKDSIKNFAILINKNIHNSSECSKKTENQHEFYINSQHISCNQFIESQICIKSSLSEPGQHEQIQSKAKNYTYQKQKLFIKASIAPQKIHSKVGIQSKITIEVQDDMEMQTSKPTYISSDVRVELGATDKSIAQYYQCK